MKKLHELLQQREELDKEIAEARANERAEALMTVLSMIRDFEFTSQDLQVKVHKLPAKKVPLQQKTFKAKKPKGTKPPKYVDPATGRTWSGYGHQPHWIEGNRDDYLIKEGKPKHAAKKRATQNNKHEKGE